MSESHPSPNTPSIIIGADLAPGGYFVWLSDRQIELKPGEIRSFAILVWAIRIKPLGLATPQDFDLMPTDQNVAHKRISRLKGQLSAAGEHSRGLIANRRGYSSYRLLVSSEQIRVRRDIEALAGLIPIRIIRDLLRTEPTLV